MDELLGSNGTNDSNRISRRALLGGAVALTAGTAEVAAQQPPSSDEPPHFRIPNAPIHREHLNVRELYDEKIPGIFIDSGVRKLFLSLLSDHFATNQKKPLGAPAEISFEPATGEMRHSAPGFRVTYKRRPNHEIAIARPEGELKHLGISVQYIDPEKGVRQEIIIVRSLEGELRTIVRGSPTLKKLPDGR
jgi:hypothetical protein